MQIKELNGQIYEVLKSLAHKNNNFIQLNELISKIFNSIDVITILFSY